MHRPPVLFLVMATAIGLSAAAWAAVAGTGTAGQGEVKFIAKQSEVSLEGRFNQFSADVELDPQRPQAAKIRVAIDLASVDAGGADANDLLKGRDFFDVARFPSATFTATSVQATGPGTFQASGPFTLKGHTSQLAIVFTTHSDSSGTWYEGAVPISRLAFDVGQGQWSDISTLDDEVRIAFRLHMAR